MAATRDIYRQVATLSGLTVCLSVLVPYLIFALAVAMAMLGFEETALRMQAHVDSCNTLALFSGIIWAAARLAAR